MASRRGLARWGGLGAHASGCAMRRLMAVGSSSAVFVWKTCSRVRRRKSLEMKVLYSVGSPFDRSPAVSGCALEHCSAGRRRGAHSKVDRIRSENPGLVGHVARVTPLSSSNFEQSDAPHIRNN
eukprot:2629049-Prymnesium_polylepis.1